MKNRHAMRRRTHKPGMSPGTLVAPPDSPAPLIRIIAYDENDIAEQQVKTVDDIIPFLKKWQRIWVDVDGLGDAVTLEKLGNIFGLHRLTLEDVLNLGHRPKTEIFENYIFMVTRMASIRESGLDIEQISVFLGKNFVLTFQERFGDCLDPVRERLRNGKGSSIRKNQADYLAYAIIDAIIDGYFPVLEKFGETLNTLEDQVIDNPQKPVIAAIHETKRDLRLLRQSIWPMREALNGFSADMTMVRDYVRPYLRDCYDHLIQVLDILEISQDRASSLIDIYLSSIGNKTNDIMRVLTMIATIFIPLSFIASVYGMNFDTDSPWNMPELTWRYGYPAVLLLMGMIAGGLLVYFRVKGWIGSFRRNP